MKATNLLNERIIISEDSFVEMVVWEIPESAKGSDHLYKYRLALATNQECVMRYDNETGKSDHKHVGDIELGYEFTTPEQLLEDFWKNVDALT